MRHVKEYWKPATVQEAVTLLQQHPQKAICIAGGTHVAVAKDPTIEYLVDITYCGLNGIEEQDRSIVIGACATLEELQASELIRSIANGILADVARWTGSAQRRNVATVGGSLVLQHDIALPLLVLNAQLTLVGKETRVMPLAELYTTAGTALQPDDIITECRISSAYADAAGAVQRQSRTRQDVTIAAVAAVTNVTDARCTNAAIALTPVESGMSRVPAAEQRLQGQPVDSERVAQAVDALKDAIRPIEDHRAGAEYRRKVLGVYTQRALMQCFSL